MTKEQIEEEIDWLLDDNRICRNILLDESSSLPDILEARHRLAGNRARIKELREKEHCHVIERRVEK